MGPPVGGRPRPRLGTGAAHARLRAGRRRRRPSAGSLACDLVFLNRPPHEIALFGPDPAALSPDHVARIADLLAEIDFPGLLASLPADESAASALIGYGTDGIVGGVRKYLLTHFNAVRRFYRDAALRHLLVVLWWD